MRKRTITLTRAETAHLIGLLIERKASGDFCGNRKHYYARTDALLNKLYPVVPTDTEEKKPKEGER